MQIHYFHRIKLLALFNSGEKKKTLLWQLEKFNSFQEFASIWWTGILNMCPRVRKSTHSSGMEAFPK